MRNPSRSGYERTDAVLGIEFYRTQNRFLLVSSGLVEDNAYEHIVGVNASVGTLCADIVDTRRRLCSLLCLVGREHGKRRRAGRVSLAP